MEVYFDNSATTKAAPEVIEAVVRAMNEDYGNPSSKHMKGVEAEKYIKEAKSTLAGILKVEEKEIFFTSGGTESNNLALIGAAKANRRAGKHIITTAIEHSSVSEVCKELEKEGFEVTYLPVDSKGHIDLGGLQKAIREDTILVSIMYVNNEIGAVQDIKAIGELIKKSNPNILFHVDAIQAFGKYEIHPKKLNIDMLSVSAHKIHGPKGTGFIYISGKAKVIPQILGGGQQKGMRSGTDNVPGAAGLSAAARLAYKDLKHNTAHMCELKDYMIDKLKEISEPSDSDGCEETVKFKMQINSEKGELSAPHILSVTFDKVKSEVLLHALEDKKIYVSAGSACASNRNEISSTLTAIGLSKEQADSTIRFSFCKDNTFEEVDYTVEMLKKIVPMLSKFVSR